MMTSTFRTDPRRVDDSTETPNQAHLAERFPYCKATLRRESGRARLHRVSEATVSRIVAAARTSAQVAR